MPEYRRQEFSVTAHVKMYSTAVCPYCLRAEALLKQARRNRNRKSPHRPRSRSQRDQMIEITGRRTVPQIFIGDKHVGGFDDLAALDRAGGLMPLLAA